MNMKDRLGLVAGALLIATWAHVGAEPIVPTKDYEVIEVLPASAGGRSELRNMRKLAAAKPADARLAAVLARRYLDLARRHGDPRFAGQALVAIAAWEHEASPPADVMLVRATVQQFLHRFDEAKGTLQQLLARPEGEVNGQAWLALATVLRVQGRLDESDQACRGIPKSAEQYRRACLAENQGLKGRIATARREFSELLAERAPSSSARSWVLTSLAELEQRDARGPAAEAAFRAALDVEPSAFVAVDVADLLIDLHRPLDAMHVLDGYERTDAVLLRLAIASRDAKSPYAAEFAKEMRERIAQANLRPDSRILHGREQALFALHVDGDAKAALVLAIGNVQYQREAIDLLILARAASAAGDAAGLAQAKTLQKEIGLYDRRIDAVH
ncbi:hypothetical protein J2X20_005897 [Pelomonas saccharophila]|uniref:Tetratricopeptide repeat protein n=1 Tax=Roseateles saccharophilus TaxID=304 RepID=A0ABU1YWH2_ROSSA|nr:hypothetical protein [Roseateles saccharophilus]MDR7273207.1 hypothetical protein [Roseateles saccharophilus]